MNDYRELAAAMRKGAALRPQTCGSMFGETATGMLGSCAIGAAYEGQTGSTEIVDSDEGMAEVLGMFGVTGEEIVRMPTIVKVVNILNAIVDLNDCYRWTREAIADWLDAL